MNLPDIIPIAAQEYRIRRAEFPVGEAVGTLDTVAKVLILASEFPNVRAELTALFHEAFHGGEYEYGLSIEDADVDRLAQVAVQVTMALVDASVGAMDVVEDDG